MREESWKFLKDLLETPSPSGYEQPAQKVARAWAEKYAEEVRTDLHGNVIAAVNPKGKPRIMLAGHCDQIGFMVQHIDENGFLFINPIGGHDTMVLIGQAVTVWTADGRIEGVLGRKPIHLLRETEEDKKPPKFVDLWVDIGVKKKKEAQKYVQIGDSVTYKLDVVEHVNNRISAVGLDDKAGTWVVMEALRLLQGQKFDAAVYSVSTVQEELGLRGAKTSAFGIDPQVGLAVDVTFATDHPGMEPKMSGEVSLDKGATIARGPNINPIVFDLLVKTAKSKRIPFQINGNSKATGTDANAIQVSGAGVAAGLVSVPNRYMHSPVEMVSLKDMEICARLLAEFILAVKKTTDFTP
jgi:endoglucanase